VFIIPAALGISLLTLVSLDGFGTKEGSYAPKPFKAPPRNTQGDSLLIGALFHRGATQ
jgi:hypothetical protein